MAIMITILLLCGLIFFTGGSVGMIRFPDFYSRLHPAGKLDTGGLVITLSAFALYTIHPLCLASVITSLKILLIGVFVFITSPTAIHSLVDAGARSGLTPWAKSKDGEA